MSQLYKNNIKFNNGISPVGAFPLNDVEVWSAWSDLFVDAENPREAALFNKAYVGMTIKIVANSDVKVLTCKNATPYQPGNEILVDDENFREYWRIEDEKVNKLAEEVDKINISSNANHNFYPGKAYEEVGANQTINAIGTFPAGTKFEDIKGEPLSDIIYKMLFECAKPVIVKDTFNDVVSNIKAFELEVGTPMPTADNFDLDNAFVSESYQWVSNANPATKGEVLPLNKVDEISVGFVAGDAGNVVFAASEIENEELVIEGETEGVYGLNGSYYINVIASQGEPAKDSNGNPCDEPKGLEEPTEFISEPIPLYGFHKLYHNAACVFADAESAALSRDINPTIWDPSLNRHIPSAKLASDKIGINEGEFSTNKFYLQWPKGLDPKKDELCVFISKKLDISAVMSCSDMTGQFNVPVSFRGPFEMERDEFIVSDLIEKVVDHPLPEGATEDDMDASCHIPHIPYELMPYLEDELVDGKNFIETHNKYIIKSADEMKYDGITTVEVTLTKAEIMPVEEH